MHLEEKYIPKDKEIKKAIELRCSRVFPAMNMANAIGGTQTVPWKLVRNFSLVALIEESFERKLSIETWEVALPVDDYPNMVVETSLYKAAVAIIEDLRK